MTDDSQYLKKTPKRLLEDNTGLEAIDDDDMISDNPETFTVDINEVKANYAKMKLNEAILFATGTEVIEKE